MKDVAGNEVEEVRGAQRRGCRWKWRIVLFAALVVALLAALLVPPTPAVFWQQRLNKQLRALADKNGGEYREEVRGPGWYLKLAEEYKLPVLRVPVIFGSDTVTDEDMAVVGRAITLREVDLRGSRISDAGMVHLSELTELSGLYLNNTQVTDAGLVHLKKLKNLEQLVLNGTEATDAGLAYLKSLKGLRYLGLAGTRVTSEGVADLKSALPNVKVDFK